MDVIAVINLIVAVDPICRHFEEAIFFAWHNCSAAQSAFTFLLVPDFTEQLKQVGVTDRMALWVHSDAVHSGPRYRAKDVVGETREFVIQ